MKKQFMVMFLILLIITTGVVAFAYQYERRNASFNNESTQTEGVSTAVNTSTAEMTTAVTTEITLSITETVPLTNIPATQPVSAIPSSWQDNGLFSAYYAMAYKKVCSMSLQEKVGQMILARCPQTNTIASIRNYHLGGFVFFEEDFDNKSASKVISSIKSYQNAAAIPMIMSVDEEGGKVIRISKNPLLWDKQFLSPQEVYAEGGLKAIRSDTLNKAKMFKKYGINLNLAPVADVSLNPSDYIYKRTLGKPAKETGNYVAAVVDTMRDSGLSSTLKHFPGYGNNINTHTGIAIDKRPYNTFQNSDFIPFEDGIKAGAESILVSHNIVQCMDKNTPASLSPAVHRILRNSLHFTGVIITDDLSMDAIKKYTNNTDPAVKAVLAGNDMLIMDDFQNGYNSIINAVKNGKIPQQQVDKAVFRILAWKYAKGIAH